VLEVLPDNRVMLGIIRRRWPEAAGERTPDAIVFRPAIRGAGSSQPLPRGIARCEPVSQGSQRVSNRTAA
jgi:hypothetical protein